MEGETLSHGDFQIPHKGIIFTFFFNLFVSDGLGVSGVFCALVSLLERMKVEKVVDVFQSVKRLRMNRPGMVANVVSIITARCS